MARSTLSSSPKPASKGARLLARCQIQIAGDFAEAAEIDVIAVVVESLDDFLLVIAVFSHPYSLIRGAFPALFVE